MPRSGDASGKGLCPHRKNHAFYAWVSFFIYAGEVRIGLIIRFLAERQKVQPQEIEWKKEYDNLLPVGASCKYLDELAESDDFTTPEVYMRIKELAAAYKAL